MWLWTVLCASLRIGPLLHPGLAEAGEIIRGYLPVVRFASHIFAISSPTLMMPPVALVVSRDPWATDLLATGAGVSTFCFGSILPFRFTYTSCRSNADNVQQSSLGTYRASPWIAPVMMKVASVWNLIVSERRAFSPVAANRHSLARPMPLLGQIALTTRQIALSACRSRSFSSRSCTRDLKLSTGYMIDQRMSYLPSNAYESLKAVAVAQTRSQFLDSGAIHFCLASQWSRS
jgi:hypothetical protein